jgi:hypothetical protein
LTEQEIGPSFCHEWDISHQPLVFLRESRPPTSRQESVILWPLLTVE